MSKILSKSKYCTGLKCPKLLWVHFNDKGRLPEWGASVQGRFAQGDTVGDLAKSLYPDGVEIVFRPGAFAEMIAETAEAVKLRKPIFEAAFGRNGAYAQADVLVPVEGDAWDVVEVKSSTSVKDVYLDDLAFQLCLYESAGLSIDRCFVMHINKQYVRRGAIEADKLFVKEDVTDEVRQRSIHVREKMEEMFETIALPECPEVGAGGQCSSPYACPLIPECQTPLPENSLHDFYRFSGKRKERLADEGVLTIPDLPDDYGLSWRNEIVREAVRTGEPQVNRTAISEFLDGLQFPQYHLDFETFHIPIPAYDQSRPYQPMPFQFSLHVWESMDSEPKHIEFLSDGKNDPRKEILESLREHIGPVGDVVAYHQSFEISRLKESAAVFPEYQSFVDGLIPRFVDLLVPFRSFVYYHPKQCGSASLKKILPVLVPELSYDELEIGDGMAASAEYARVTFCDVSDEERARVRASLLRYCHLDTLALVRIIQALERLALK